MEIMTKGNVIVNEIKIGDIHYEFENGFGIKSEVISLPVNNGEGYWSWKSKNTKSGVEIEYGVSEGMSHYAPNLYNYVAYAGVEWI